MPSIDYSQDFEVDDGTPDSFFNEARTTVSPITGVGSLRLNPTAQQAYWIKNSTARPVQVMKFKFKFTTFPAIDINLCDNVINGLGDYGVKWDAASGKLKAWSFDGGTVGGPVIVAGTTYTVDVRFDGTNAIHTVDAMIDGVALTQATRNGGAGTLANYVLGDSDAAGSTYDVRFDDLFVSHLSADYPISFPTATIAWLTA